MIFSVYNYQSKAFNYYEANVGPMPATGWFRKGANAKHPPEASAARVPPGARLVGSGPTPRGLIAVHPGAVASLGTVAPAAGAASDGNSAEAAASWTGLLTFAGLAFWLGRKSIGWESKARASAKRFGGGAS